MIAQESIDNAFINMIMHTTLIFTKCTSVCDLTNLLNALHSPSTRNILHILSLCTSWEIYTPYAGFVGMLDHKHEKCTMLKLKRSLLYTFVGHSVVFI